MSAGECEGNQYILSVDVHGIFRFQSDQLPWLQLKMHLWVFVKLAYGPELYPYTDVWCCQCHNGSVHAGTTITSVQWLWLACTPLQLTWFAVILVWQHESTLPQTSSSHGLKDPGDVRMSSFWSVYVSPCLNLFNFSLYVLAPFINDSN